MEVKTDTLFIACTRPAMFIGIPLQAFAVLLICCGEFFVLSGLSGAGVSRLVVSGVLGAAGYGACRIAVAKDHNMFGILFLWATTKGRASRNALYWRGSSASPSPVHPARKATELVCYV
jgi:type IV secretion system protein VirB3